MVRPAALGVSVVSVPKLARTATIILSVIMSRSARLPSSFNEAMTSPPGTSSTLVVMRSWSPMR